MAPLKLHARLASACLGLLLVHGCDRGKQDTDSKAQDTKQDESKPPTAAEKRPTLVETPAFGAAPTVKEMIVEIVGDEARLVNSTSVGPAIDFAKRSAKDEHVRAALLDAMDDRFFKALEAKDPHVRVRLDAGATGLSLGDVIHTLGELGVVGWELELSTAEGSRAVPVTLPKSCFGEATDRRCTTLHLRTTPDGTLASLVLTDAITRCDLPPAESGSFAAISGRPITPSADACPGWPHFVPNDEQLGQLLAAVEALGPLCGGVEVSVDDGVPASKFLPTMAALVTAGKPVIFAAKGRAACGAADGAVVLDTIASKK